MTPTLTVLETWSAAQTTVERQSLGFPPPRTAASNPTIARGGLTTGRVVPPASPVRTKVETATVTPTVRQD